MESFLNAFFAGGSRLVPAAILLIVLAALWIGRKDRFFLPRRWWRRALDAVLLLALVLVVAASCFAASVQRELEARVGRLVFHLVADGSARRIADYRGRVIVLNLWATWCGPCLEEMPNLDRLARAHRSDGVVVLTATDEPVEDVRRYERETAPLATDSATFEDASPPEGAIASTACNGRPTTVILDREGAIRRVLVGAQSYETFERLVRERL